MKRPISVTLNPDNLVWLQARMLATGRRSVSETLDSLLSEARLGGRKEEIRSVRGTIAIAASDPDLLRADAALRKLFRISLARGVARQRAKGRRPALDHRRRRAPERRERG